MTIRQKLATFTIAGSLLFGGVVTIGAGTAGAAQRPSQSAPAAHDQVASTAAAALAAIDTDQYIRRLSDVTYVVATRLGVDSGRLHRAWTSADRSHQIALLAALSQVGVPYRRNTSKPGVGFDCSGLTTYAWAQAGVTLVRQSGAQIRNAAPRTRETAQAGDLVQYPGHVMMWLGVDSLIVQAANFARDVEVGVIAKRRANGVKFGDPTG